MYADNIDYAVRRRNFCTSLHAFMKGIVRTIALCLIGAYRKTVFSSVSQEVSVSNFRISLVA